MNNSKIELDSGKIDKDFSITKEIPIISLQNITFSYFDTLALYNVNLDIWKGEYIGICGPNGSGKTTLLKIILGEIHSEVGKITIFGETIHEGKISPKIRQKIAYVPQVVNIDRNFPALVEDVVMMGRYSQIGIFRPITKRDRAIIQKAISLMQLNGFEKRPIGHLSGGQQQKVLIAKALAQEPEILLLDEPTSALDFKIARELGQLIKNLHEQSGLTILEVNHNLKLLQEHADRIVIIDRAIAWIGSSNAPEFN
ncbi:MAG: metal ABC transporter ATP-binding protein, partial [Candidatus Helarchaeota archaeon]